MSELSVYSLEGAIIGTSTTNRWYPTREQLLLAAEQRTIIISEANRTLITIKNRYRNELKSLGWWRRIFEAKHINREYVAATTPLITLIQENLKVINNLEKRIKATIPDYDYIPELESVEVSPGVFEQQIKGAHKKDTTSISN